MQVDAQIGQNLVINRFVSDPDNIETHVVISDVDPLTNLAGLAEADAVAAVLARGRVIVDAT